MSNNLPPLCADCLAHEGLCVGCAQNDRGILPQLAIPPWVKLIAKPKDPAAAGADDVAFVLPSLNTPGRKAARRLGRALRGEFTRTVRTA